MDCFLKKGVTQEGVNIVKVMNMVSNLQAFTGSNTVSSVARKSKVKVWKIA